MWRVIAVECNGQRVAKFFDAILPPDALLEPYRSSVIAACSCKGFIARTHPSRTRIIVNEAGGGRCVSLARLSAEYP